MCEGEKTKRKKGKKKEKGKTKSFWVGLNSFKITKILINIKTKGSFGNNLFSWNWKFFVENIVDKVKKLTEIIQWNP